MKPAKAYILRTPHEKSMIYSEDVAKSCDAINLKWEYVDWYLREPELAWENTGVTKPRRVSGHPAAQCCYSGHIAIWKKILDSDEAGIILEHDGHMLHYIDIEIPENTIVVLGYKLENPDRYDHVTAGAPQEIIDTLGGGHEGSHAYAITPNTAQKLIDEVIESGCISSIDHQYFLKSRRNTIPIKIMSPTPAIGWIRESTIQGRSSTRNYEFIESFKQHLKS